MAKAEDAGAFLFGLAVGALGLAILGAIFRPKCPNCGAQINQGVPTCPNCHTFLRWE